MKNKLIILAILLLTLFNITKSIASCKLDSKFKALDLDVNIDAIINTSYNDTKDFLIGQFGPMELASKAKINAKSVIATCESSESIRFKTFSSNHLNNDNRIEIKTSAKNLYFYIEYNNKIENNKITLESIGEIRVYLRQKGNLTSEDRLKKELISSLSTYDGKNLINITYNKETVIKSTSCMTSTPFKKISLGRHKLSDFNGKGTAAKKHIPFDIAIECKDNIMPTVVFSGETIDGVALGDEGSVIKLNEYNSGKQAKGIGIQMVHHTTREPIAMGKDIKLTFLRKNEYKDYFYHIPLAAHYYQTDDTITGGTANASVHFTLKYK
ncbi:fimbrial protein [Photorhabdus asymbiotica]|uniref:fimbrial protein n=1 Tax=Photorhabdus asymbiotica TaxID=291112 RepID=UPI003DA6D2A6